MEKTKIGQQDREKLRSIKLPQNIEAEKGLLGAILHDNKIVGEIVEKVSASDFFLPIHKIIFEKILELYDKHQPIDVVILKDALLKDGKLQGVEIIDYLLEIYEFVPNVANAVHYAKSIRDKASLRSIMTTCDDTISFISNGEEQEPEIVLEEVERKIFETIKKREISVVSGIGDVLSEVFHKIEAIGARDGKSHLLGIPTGFGELDYAISGLQRGSLIVIAGRPGMGKTSLGISIARKVGLEQKKVIHFFSLEMTKEQIAQIMLCSLSGISPINLTNGTISDEDIQKLLITAGKFENAGIFIDDSPDLSMLEVKARARRFKADKNTDLIILDYLQLMHTTDRRIENRQQEIALISRSLKALAKELNIPIIALSQLNRAPEAREEHKPRLADLRESGAIEQDADVVLLLNREEVYNRETDKKNICDVNIAKNRTGPTKTIQFAFISSYMRFEPLEKMTE